MGELEGLSFVMGPVESKERGHHTDVSLATHPKAGLMAEICKGWVEGKPEERPEVRPVKKIRPKVSNEEMDRRALEIWERKKLVE